MNLKPWQKVMWWLFLISVLSYYLFQRLEDLKGGHSAPVDVFVFLIWIALLLTPLFNEMSFFGFKFKQELDEAKKSISQQMSLLESKIQNSVAVNPQFNLGTLAPPPDSQLPALKEKIDLILAEVTKTPPSLPAINWRPDVVNEDAEYLFRTRLQIEVQLRRLFKELTRKEPPRAGALQMLPSLISAGLISDQIAIAIREVYSVCSPAIHGEVVSRAQVDFVSKTAPQLIGVLQMLRAFP